MPLGHQLFSGSSLRLIGLRKSSRTEQIQKFTIALGGTPDQSSRPPVKRPQVQQRADHHQIPNHQRRRQRDLGGGFTLGSHLLLQVDMNVPQPAFQRIGLVVGQSVDPPAMIEVRSSSRTDQIVLDVSPHVQPTRPE